MSTEVAARIAQVRALARDPLDSVFGPDDEYLPDSPRPVWEHSRDEEIRDDDPAQFDTLEEMRHGHQLAAHRYWLAMNAGTL